MLKIISFLIAKCTGGDDCCTQDNPCGLGEGDCDHDSDCKPGLYCGLDNCGGSGWEYFDDCCEIDLPWCNDTPSLLGPGPCRRS